MTSNNSDQNPESQKVDLTAKKAAKEVRGEKIHWVVAWALVGILWIFGARQEVDQDQEDSVLEVVAKEGAKEARRQRVYWIVAAMVVVGASVVVAGVIGGQLHSPDDVSAAYLLVTMVSLPAAGGCIIAGSSGMSQRSWTRCVSRWHLRGSYFLSWASSPASTMFRNCPRVWATFLPAY